MRRQEPEVSSQESEGWGGMLLRSISMFNINTAPLRSRLFGASWGCADKDMASVFLLSNES